MATVSKFTTKVHSWSPAGTKLGEMCWQTAKGNINWGGLEATSVGSVHNSKKGMVSSWTEKTTQYLEIKKLGFLVKTWWCSCCSAFLNEFQMVEIEKKNIKNWFLVMEKPHGGGGIIEFWKRAYFLVTWIKENWTEKLLYEMTLLSNRVTKRI